jgi:hypothetical protein
MYAQSCEPHCLQFVLKRSQGLRLLVLIIHSLKIISAPPASRPVRSRHFALPHLNIHTQYAIWSKVVLAFIAMGDGYMVKVDFKNAYRQVSIRWQDRQLLVFFCEGLGYGYYLCAPFGGFGGSSSSFNWAADLQAAAASKIHRQWFVAGKPVTAKQARAAKKEGNTVEIVESGGTGGTSPHTYIHPYVYNYNYTLLYIILYPYSMLLYSTLYYLKLYFNKPYVYLKLFCCTGDESMP